MMITGFLTVTIQAVNAICNGGKKGTYKNCYWRYKSRKTGKILEAKPTKKKNGLSKDQHI